MPILQSLFSIVNVKWGGAKYTIEASVFRVWTTPEEAEPSIASPTVSGPYIGRVDILSGPFEMPHPEDENRWLYQLLTPSSIREEGEEFERSVCTSQKYELWVVQRAVLPDGSLGPVELTFKHGDDISASFSNAEQAQQWAAQFDDPMFLTVSHMAKPVGACEESEVLKGRGMSSGESNSVTINVDAIRELMRGDDPDAPIPDVVLYVTVPGFSQTRTSGVAGASVILSGRFPEFMASLDDVKQPDVTEQDIPGQVFTVTIKPDGEVIIQ